jgi:23S rRNA (uracil-5-)-methyltransferase RumA
MAKKHEIIEGTITKNIFPNKGVLYIEDQEPVYVPDAFIGQKVQVRLLKKRKGKWEGKILEVLEKPNHFIDPKCSLFGTCGGCNLQHFSYEKQLQHKYQLVKGLLEEAGITGYEDKGIVQSPSPWHYRNKMEFTFGDEYKNGPLTLGMHKKNSSFDIVTVEQCHIVDKDFGSILRYTLDYMEEKKLPFYRNRSHEGYLRYLVVRRSETTKELLVNLVTTTQLQVDFTDFATQMAKLPLQGSVKGVLHTHSDTLADAVKPDETKILYGEDFLTEEILGLQFNLSPFSFFQTNTEGARVLYETALGMLDNINEKTVFDLYSGTGTIAQIMATKANEVYGIEIVEEAVEKAKENAKLNGLQNCHFIAGDVLAQVDQLKEKPDIIVIDPPREGIHPKAIHKIIDFGAKEMLYISCKPTSLARDLPVFEERGYEVKEVCCVDMFPSTVHVETVVLLSRVEK